MKILNEETKKKVVEDLIHFFKTERNEEIGIIAAEAIVDHILEDLGTKIYNKGVEDSKLMIKDKFEDIEVELDSLRK